MFLIFFKTQDFLEKFSALSDRSQLENVKKKA